VAVLEFSTAKNLGLGGSIVAIIGTLLSIIPALSFLGLILMLLGVILVLVALRGLSEVYGDKSIFRNALGATIAIILLWIFIFVVIALLGPAGAMAGEQRATEVLGASAIAPILVIVATFAIAPILVVMAVAVSAILWYRALRALSARSRVGMFRWAAIFYAISAVIFVVGLLLTIVLIGIFIVLIAGVVNLASFILLALGFSSLKPPITQAPQSGV
jgi:uncharacterized membrane protein